MCAWFERRGLGVDVETLFGDCAALAAGPRPSKALQQEAAAHGHTERTLARALRAEEIVIRKQPGRHGAWTWDLPLPPQDSTQCTGEPG